MGKHHHGAVSEDQSAHHHAAVQAEHRIEGYLKKNPHDYAHVYREINQLRHNNPHFNEDLKYVNHQLHKHGYLPHMRIVEDDHVDKIVHGKAHYVHGLDVVADDPRLKGLPGNGTIVSTSHHAPKESDQLRRAYGSMHYNHGRYNGWDQSVAGNHGADGGYARDSVGGFVPEGARKELIDKALQLAGLEVTPQNEAAVNKIVCRESNWDPNITNRWDSNAQAGHPSTGLMQCIPETFRRYALDGYNENINDPLSNLVAGIRYAQARYARNGMSGVEVVASRPGGY